MSAERKPMLRRTASGSFRMSWPFRDAVPWLGVMTVASIRSVVVLPAPFGPSRPKISPARTSNETRSTAWTAPPLGPRKVLVSSCTRIMRLGPL